MYKKLIATGLFALSVFIQIQGYSEKVLIFTYSYNRPDFIEIQAKTFKKFLKDEYEFVVFNDARTLDMQTKIRNTCRRLNVQCIDIPQEIHDKPYLPRLPRENYNDPAVRNVNVVMYSLHQLGFFHSGIVALFDSDLFLVKEFSIQEFMKNHDVAGVYQSREKDGLIVNYLWIGCTFLDMSKMPDRETITFNCGEISGIPVDAGGHTYWYLRNHPELRIRYIDEVTPPFAPLCDACQKTNNTICKHNTELLEEKKFDHYQIKLIQSAIPSYVFLQNQSFLHYYAGTNWNNMDPSYHQVKTRIINEYIKNILDN